LDLIILEVFSNLGFYDLEDFPLVCGFFPLSVRNTEKQLL